MFIIVYSGSRQANWRLIDKGRVLLAFKTIGINPYIHDDRFIFQILNRNTELINNAENIRRIYFFGAGASSLERKNKISRVFLDFFKNAKIKVNHDILASALAAFGNEKGIIGILGSGSNAAYYNGKKIIENNYGLGYILADEGSTNWISQQLLRDFLTNTMPQGFREEMLKHFPIERKIILDKIYNSPNPNTYLNSFSELIFENKNDVYIKGIIKHGIEKFFKNYLVPLSEAYPDSILNLTGTVAFHCSDIIRELADDRQITLGVIVEEPIQNLVKYYINKN